LMEVDASEVDASELLKLLQRCTLNGVNDYPPKHDPTFWSNLFQVKFREELPNVDTSYHSDDCLYFVRNLEISSKNTEDEKFFVRRRDGKQLPEKGDPCINWEETFFLNVLLHHFEYQIDVSVRRRGDVNSVGKKKLEVIKRVAKKVYATPNKTRMDTSKAEEVQLTYPILYFAIDDFNEAWKDISLTEDDQLVCVELFAAGDYFVPGKHVRTRLFAGALDYEVVKKEYVAKKWVWTAAATPHFFNLKGPHGKGAAQMAVTSQQPETSGSWLSFGFRTPSNPKLNCSLTFLNMRWDLLVTDLMNVFNGKVKKENRCST